MTASKPRCWALPARCLHRRPTPSRHPTRMSPLFLCIPFDAAERVGFQPAAEPRDFKCHPNGLHVLRALCACPASSLHSWVLPARCLRRRRPTPDCHLPPHDVPIRLGRMRTRCPTQTSSSSVAHGRATPSLSVCTVRLGAAWAHAESGWWLRLPMPTCSSTGAV